MMIPEIVDIELIVHYKVNGNDCEMSKTTLENWGFSFHILDKERNNSTGRTSIEFTDIEELRNIINDFEERFKSVTTNTKKIKK